MKLKEYMALCGPGAEITCWDKDVDSEFYFYTKEQGEKSLYGKDFPNVDKCMARLAEVLDVVSIHDGGVEVNLYEVLEHPKIVQYAKENFYTENQYEDDAGVTMLLFDDNDKNISQGYEQFSRMMVECLNEAFGEAHGRGVEDTQTRWVCVYKDTITPHAGIDNLVNIEVPAGWLYKALKAQGEEDIEAWFDEYTADNTEAIARKAVVDGVILGCDDEFVAIVLKLRRENPELVESADKVKDWVERLGDNIPDGLGFEFKGMHINNPFYDESMRFEVEPCAYYGIENMTKYLQQAADIMSRDGDKHMDLDDVIGSCEKLSKEGSKRDMAPERSTDRQL